MAFPQSCHYVEREMVAREWHASSDDESNLPFYVPFEVSHDEWEVSSEPLHLERCRVKEPLM
jgi:hypothetical protein